MEPSKRSLRIEHALLVGALAAYAAYLLYYLSTPVFKDHLEPAVGAIACALGRGQAPYGDAGYELPYGPALFLLHAGVFALLTPSVFALKLPAIAANLAACVALFVALRRKSNLRPAAGGLLFALALLVSYDERAYWCRPEPFLFLGSAVALLLARIHPRGVMPMLAVVVAWLIGFKITGWLYAIPALAELRHRRAAAPALLAGAALSAALFLHPDLSMLAYAHVLGKTAQHGLAAKELASNLRAAAVLLAPAVLARIARRRLGLATTSTSLLPLAASIAAVSIVAAKPGAGYHHLLPFVPFAVDALVREIDRVEVPFGALAARTGTLATRVVGAALVVLLSIAHYREARAVEPEARERNAELSYVLYKYRGEEVAMGYAASDRYDDTFGKFDVAVAGNALRLDGASFMDSRAAGWTASRALGDALRACNPPVFVLPKGKPFALGTFYRTHEPLFDDEFRALFAAHYHLAERGEHYDVYRCSR